MIAGRVLLVGLAQTRLSSANNAIKGTGAGFIKVAAAICVGEMAVETNKRSSAVVYVGAIASLGSACAYWL